MKGSQVVRSLVQPGDLTMQLDLKFASHNKYLRFVYQDGTYEFQCLPFGLSSAPRAFTKTLKPVLAALRSLGIWIVIYIDDMLLLHQQSRVLKQLFVQVIDCLEKLDFLFKIEKCSVTPCQCKVFVGTHLDSSTMTLSLPQPKLGSILSTCLLLLAKKSGSLRTLSTLSHVSQTGIMLSPLHYRGWGKLTREYLLEVTAVSRRRMHTSMCWKYGLPRYPWKHYYDISDLYRNMSTCRPIIRKQWHT